MGGFKRHFSTASGSERELTEVIHNHDDDSGDEVACSRLNVVLKRDDEFWYAQGVQIDYVAQGVNIEDVQAKFVEGLAETLLLHAQRFGSVEKVLRWAPESEWKDELHNEHYRVSFHAFDDNETRQLAELLPFSGVLYSIPQSQAA